MINSYSVPHRSTMTKVCTKGGVTQYQLSAGCGHGGLFSSTSAGSSSKEKNRGRNFLSSTKKGTLACGLSLLVATADLADRGQGLRFGAWAWHGRRREVGVSEISGVRSGALFSAPQFVAVLPSCPLAHLRRTLPQAAAATWR